MPRQNYDYCKLSNTRGASLANLTGLCRILGEVGTLNVKQLANIAIKEGVFNFDPVSVGERIPTRIHHHMIALRMLELVEDMPTKGHVYYELAPLGKRLFEAISSELASSAVDDSGFSDTLLLAWRVTLAASNYVKCQWLKYFMRDTDFDHQAFAFEGTPITVYRLPMSERMDSDRDSGYRLRSPYWGEISLDMLAYREIYQGLRRWTNQVLLTDDRLPDDTLAYSYQSQDEESFETKIFVVKAWLSRHQDLKAFEDKIDQLLDKEGINRITLPDLIMGLCRHHGYSKAQVRAMLEQVYYHGQNHYFFERGSRFLVHNAFNVAEPEDYYVQIEGVWRTGLVRN